MAKELPVHYDLIGRELAVGDCVAFPGYNSLSIGTVVKLNPKMIGVVNIKSKRSRAQLKYPGDLVKLDGPDVTFYLLKNTGST